MHGMRGKEASAWYFKRVSHAQDITHGLRRANGAVQAMRGR